MGRRLNTPPLSRPLSKKDNREPPGPSSRSPPHCRLMSRLDASNACARRRRSASHQEHAGRRKPSSLLQLCSQTPLLLLIGGGRGGNTPGRKKQRNVRTDPWVPCLEVVATQRGKRERGDVWEGAHVLVSLSLSSLLSLLSPLLPPTLPFALSPKRTCCTTLLNQLLETHP
jgi:hypothetical protein